MSWNSFRMVFIYGVSIALFVTLAFTNQSPNHSWNESYSRQSTLPTLIIQSDLLPIISYASQVQIQEPLPVAAKGTPKQNHEIRMSTYEPIQESITPIEETTITYEVTTPFLNVRSQPSAKSKIIKVIKEGDRLDVLEHKENGWLKLMNGGYIHGGYAKQLNQSKENKPGVSVQVDKPIELVASVHPSVMDHKLEPGKPTSKVKSESGLNEEHISKLFKGTALEDEGLEEVILAIEQEYGINAFFTIAVLKLESGNGKSKLAKKKNNLFGLNAIDGDAHRSAFSFKTKGDSVRKFGQLISKNYVGKGYTTIEKVAKKYCPSNEDWPSLVTTIMKSDYRKL